MKKLPISICILSWHSAKTLQNTLASYKKNGLLDLSDDVCILFQEVTAEDEKLAKKFGVKFIGLNENIGIGNGIIHLAENAKHQRFLFLENDWELVENKKTVFERLSSGLNLLNQGFDVVRYRSREKYGFPLHSLRHKGNELGYYDDWHLVTSPHLLESLHWLNPAKEFPDKIQKNGDYFVTTSRWANWTNNPFLIDKDFYLEKIAPFAGEGLEFERKIAPWWVKQNFKIAQGEGLFMHNDLKKYPKKTILKMTLSMVKKLFKK